MVSSTFIILLLLVILLAVIVVSLLAFVLSRQRPNGNHETSQDRPVRHKTAVDHIEEENSLSGESLLEDEQHLEAEYHRLDGSQDVMVSQSAPARKNGRPH